MSHALIRNIGRAGDTAWRRLPLPMRDGVPGRVVGRWIHALARNFSSRGQSESTWFFRNEPLLLTIQEIINGTFNSADVVRICSMGCSTGAEIYSALWKIRKARPDLEVISLGIDISAAALEKAQQGAYLRQDMEFRGENRGNASCDLFETEGQYVRVKACIKDGTRWAQGDARDRRLASVFGLHDIVLANNFLVHMDRSQASSALANVARLVKPGGFLVCRGVDLSVRESVTRRLHLKPIPIRIEQIHDAELSLDARCHWPWKYYGLEPLSKNRKGWMQRYAAIFQVSS